MTGLLLVLVLIFAALTVFLWAGTLFFQGYIYNEPAGQLYWRAPAAAGLLTAFLAFWCYLDYRIIVAAAPAPGSGAAAAPPTGRYNTLFEFSARDDTEFKRFWSVKKGQETLFVGKHTPQGRIEYRDSRGKLWTRSDAEGVAEAVIVEDSDGERHRFNAELTKDGKFKAERGEPVRYVEENGQHRVMTDDTIGRLSVTRWGFILANLALNFLHLAVWFLGLWLILRYQWSHALGLAIVFWLVLTFVLPALFRRTEDAARQKLATPVAAAVGPSLEWQNQVRPVGC